MKKLSTLTKAVAIAIGALSLSGVAMAGAVVIDDDMPRRAPGSTSGSGDTVEANCPTDPSGNDWQGATATLMVRQVGSESTADIKVNGAVPNTVFTVWLRMAGSGPGGDLIGCTNPDQLDANGDAKSCNPMNGGGATPLAPGYALDDMLHYSPPFAGTSTPTNGFTTDNKGNAHFKIDLDFPVVGGAYPFQKASDAAVQALIGAGSSWPLARIPSAIVNPSDPNIGGPFLLRVISHCTDQEGHGLSPATREAWFQYP